jgi:hypothetical protein
MTGALPSEQETTFAETYDRLAMAWSNHEDLRFAGAPIPELNQSSIDLNNARNEMWARWRENRIQEVR